MTLLYRGVYRRRFNEICKHLHGSRVTELCFADTYIARYCRQQQIDWTGLDINPYFVKRAQEKGYKAICTDIAQADAFPAADTLIISGSLYHFIPRADSLLLKMCEAAPVVIICEPVHNISTQNNIFGKMALWFSSINGQRYPERFSKTSLEVLAMECAGNRQMTCTTKMINKRDLLVILKK